MASSNKKTLYLRFVTGKELEMEYDIGNINNRDFIEMRDKLKQEVSEVISKLNK